MILVRFAIMLLVAALAWPLRAALEKTDLQLNDGRILKAARIVTIGEQVGIVHAGGLLNVPADVVPLDVLARAQMEMDATAKEREAKNAERAARAREAADADQKQRDEEIRLRLAVANARAIAQGEKPVAPPPPARPVVNAGQLIANLKASFPAQGKARYQVFIKGKRPRTDTLELDLPSTDQWSNYKT